MVRPGKAVSVRIVSVDHYMTEPDGRFDACFSEFRSAEVRMVPVVRLFGSTADGTHSCVHIHGVFPYLYVPYEPETPDRAAADRLMYQLAASLDKAINVSLARSKSTATHVHKVVLVKGIPIYGYHHDDHYFFKIYMYNPHYVRRACNMLMNGVILSRKFQTFESHVPYILQFFIDYNLYGMSMLHVAEGGVFERTAATDGTRHHANALPKMSTSALEFDMQAQHILNRTGVTATGSKSEYANPGIASIWQDEQRRRELLGMEQPDPINASHADKDADLVTESDRFYRATLAAKLQNAANLTWSPSMTNTTTTTTEASQEGNVLDASQVVHDDRDDNESLLFSQRSFHIDSSCEVDEERILSMSQIIRNVSLDADDLDALEMMRHLEESQDRDSLLAPLTQHGIRQLSGSSLNQSQVSNRQPNREASPDRCNEEQLELEGSDDDNFDSDDEFLRDFTLKMDSQLEACETSDSIVEDNLRDSDDELLDFRNFPQLDGGDDQSYSPVKRGRGKLTSRGLFFNETPRKRMKYSEEMRNREAATFAAPTGVVPNGTPGQSVPLVAVEQTMGIRNFSICIQRLEQEMYEREYRANQRQLRDRNVTEQEELITISDSDSDPQLDKNREQSSSATVTESTIQLAHDYDRANNWDPQEGLSYRRPKKRGRPRAPPAGKRTVEPELDVDRMLSERFKNIIKLSPKVLLTPLSMVGKATANVELEIEPTKQRSPSPTQGVIEITDDDDSHQTDVAVLQDGNSDLAIPMPIPTQRPNTSDDEVETDLAIRSFCEQTLVCEVDDMLTDESVEHVETLDATLTGKSVTITVLDRPPTYDEATDAIENLEIPAVTNQTPFYGNPEDITGRKEVGHTVLSITGNALNDLEPFRSVITGLGSVNQLRYEKLQTAYGDCLDEILPPPQGGKPPCADGIKQLLASEQLVIISPSILPPSRRVAKSWLAALKTEQQQKQAADKDVEAESPVKVKRAEAIMTIADTTETSPDGRGIDVESSLNLSTLLTSIKTQKEGHHDNEPILLVSKIMSLNSTVTSSVEHADDDIVESSPTSPARKLKRREAKAKQSPSASSKRPRKDTGAQPMENSTTPATEEEAVESSQASTESFPSSISTLPTTSEINSIRKRLNVADLSQTMDHSGDNISAVTPIDSTHTYEEYRPKGNCEYNYLTLLSVEVHVQTRGDLLPDPNVDPIGALFYRVHNDVPQDHDRAPSVCGIIMNRASGMVHEEVPVKEAYRYNQSRYVADVVTVNSERELYEKFLLLISFWDPDIFAGYEIEAASWGYLIQRGNALEMNVMKMLSRVPTLEKVQVQEDAEQEMLEMHDYSSELQIPGRILLDIWRLMRHEIALTSYTYENIAYHVLHRRVPCHSWKQLTRLWNKPYSKWIVIEYFLERVNGNLEVLQKLDLISRTAEMAKLFGIQFYEVLSRGSQFRVESMMLRIAKPRNFVSVSPSVEQRAYMRAPEYLPLILEPSSRFYADPLIVLDFQSLYPSMIIAYNYCFSTCLGRIEHLPSSDPFVFGASQLEQSPTLLKTLLDDNQLTVSPCGIAFVKQSVREGVLPRMLSEILNTRLMVKQSMKLHKDSSVLQRVLHSRQLGLKLIANVTYGYTAANFSGRMPCVEVGDSVVAKGRETLERAIKLVEATEKWGAKVVYGDTDSLFVLCPGRTKEAAFAIGAEIAEAVTKANPPPVKLKLEKVYQPSILQTKKRYVGFMYETPDQEKPTYEAKGIETVRRDGCPVVAKMLEKVLRILFETCDVSKVKQYTCRQFTKILEGRVNLQDFIFAKEFRGTNGYKPGACVPALELTRKWQLSDARRMPRKGQRVPYVVVNGPPQVPLIRLIRSPEELLIDSALKVNADYYITKAITPPLNRCLLLIGADVRQWYNEMPRKYALLHNTGGGKATVATALNLPKKSTIAQYFSTTSCIIDCGEQTHDGICKVCRLRPQHSVSYVLNKINKLERRLEQTDKMCQSCCQRGFETACTSLDCPVLFVQRRRLLEYNQVPYYRDLMEQLF